MPINESIKEIHEYIRTCIRVEVRNGMPNEIDKILGNFNTKIAIKLNIEE